MSGVVGRVFGGRWKIERPLATGGMGAVFMAVHTDTGRRVALKLIKDDGARNPELVARFRKETGALAAVSHPNVVTFLDSGVEDGTFYLVMELLEGRPLRAVMGAPLPWRRAFRIGADVCRALSAVHKAGIVHRDLKPENVFLQDAEGHDEIAKLIDFGIVRLHDRTSATMTRSGAVVGTPGYIAPEQLQGQDASPASDIYAVGVILYELVTGKFPFDAPTPHAMIVRQLIEPLVPPHQALDTLPAHVERVILQFMERDPAVRVRTAKDALAVLVDALSLTDSLAPSAPTEMALRAAAPPTPPTPPAPPAPSTAAPPTFPTPAAPALVAPRRQRSAGEKVLLAAGIALLGTLGMCGMCVTGGVLKSCLSVDTPAPASPTAVAVPPSGPATPTTTSPHATAAQQGEAQALAMAKAADATAGLDDSDDDDVHTHADPGVGADDDSDDEDVDLPASALAALAHDSGGGPLPAPPPAPLVKAMVRAAAPAFALCGGGKKRMNLKITLANDGRFHLDNKATTGPLKCAHDVLAELRGPRFQGKPVSVTAALALGD